MSNLSPLIVAIDSELDHAKQLVEILDPTLCRLKVGKGLFTEAGPAIVEWMHQKGFEVFLDLKFHDIPNTVAHAVRSAANLGVWMINVHASGGEKMMCAAREAIDKTTSAHKPLLTAVTLLTSLSAAEISAIGYQGTPESLIQSMALMAKKSGLEGIVCSAQEAKMIAHICGNDFISVCPGIRPMLPILSSDDQTRIMTPMNALKEGAHYLVLGRPITQAIDPNKALIDIIESIKG